ncbi:MAG: peptidylprolyl isomerase [Burkholderiales bacterium]|nr:peptidylprolyl isomerase [Burkholderiales bacterium]
MFDFVHSNRNMVAIAFGMVGLGLLVGSGLTSVGGSGAGQAYIAKVDDTAVTERDIANLTHGQDVPATMRPRVVEEVVQRRVLLNEADQRGLMAGADMVREQIAAVPDFQKNGQFDPVIYKTLLANSHMTPQQFEDSVRDQARLSLLMEAIGGGKVSSSLVADRVIDVLNTTRDVSTVTLTAQQYLDKVAVSDADIKQYYDAHHADFNVPERVKLDYLVLSRDDMAASQTVSDADIKAYYDAHKAELAPEERKVSHILIKVDDKAPQAARDAAKKKAEGILAELKKDPSRFAELAKQNSDDTASAIQGGDLGYFANNGTMVKPFSDTAFKMNKGQISDLVETQFGYHILQLQDIRTKSLDDVKSTVVARLQHNAASSQFSSVADKFNDAVYQQADSLQPAADQFKLAIKHSDWVTRDKAADPTLNNDKVREAAFSNDVLVKHHNSEAVDLGNGVMVSVHVVDHQVAALQPLAEVSKQISDKLKLERATKMAQDEGKKKLAALQKGDAEPSLSWSAANPVNQFNRAGLDKDAMSAVFGVQAAKLPGYAGKDVPNGYTLFKVAAGKATPVDPARRASLEQSLEQALGGSQAAAYVTDLRSHHKVQMH